MSRGLGRGLHAVGLQLPSIHGGLVNQLGSVS